MFDKENERRKNMAFNLKRLRAERVAAGMTQEQIAKKVGLSREAYAKRENGLIKISVEDLANILHALGYDASKSSIFFEHNVRNKEQKVSE